MIAVAAGVKVLVATKPVDFRKGADGLVALVREALGHDPFSEDLQKALARHTIASRGNLASVTIPEGPREAMGF